jgi:hypothetical protein
LFQQTGLCTLSLKVGLGYDPFTRKSNSFIGTILRRTGLNAKVPASAVAHALGFDFDFDVWTWWDQELQQLIAQLLKPKGPGT